MNTKQEVITYCLTFNGVYEDYPFEDLRWTCMRIHKTKKIFAWIFPKDGFIWVNVKCDPQWRDLWRNTYDSVLPGWHMNKKHWNSIVLDGTVPQEEIRRMIAESYDLCSKIRKSPIES